jgi:hypothetical protein
MKCPYDGPLHNLASLVYRGESFAEHDSPTESYCADVLCRTRQWAISVAAVAASPNRRDSRAIPGDYDANCVKRLVPAK